MCWSYIPKSNVREISGLLLLRDIGPVPGSGHHGLGIDGSKSKVVANLQTSSIGSPGAGISGSCQTLVSGCVDYQILDIPPSQIMAVC